MPDILNKKEWNTRQVVFAIAFAVSFTFTITMIWSRFLFVENGMSTLSDRVEKKDARLVEWVTEIENRVKKLEMPNTD